MGASSLLYATTLPSLETVSIRDVIFLICYVVLKNHAIKGSCDLMGGSPQGKPSYCEV